MGIDLQNLQPVKASDVSFSPLPEGNATVANCVSVLQTGKMKCKGSLFVKGWEGEMELIDYAFLIEHGTDKIVFDLGLRKNLEYEGMKEDLEERWQAESRKSVQELLTQLPNVEIEDIDYIVLSHLHFDHIGRVSEWDKKVGLILGPMEEELQGEELAKKLKVDSSSLDGRQILYLSRTKEKWEQIGAFKGIDFYGDGTVWFLDAPGHAPGHIACLVQTAPDAWYLLGGDGAHHVSLIDQNNPTTIGAFKAKENPASDQSDPERLITFEDDIEESMQTIAKFARMEQEESVLVWLAHDSTLGPPLISSDAEKLSGDLDELTGFKMRDRGKWPIKA